MELRPMRWDGNALAMLDQRELPLRETWLRLTTWQEVADAIRDMAVRGAPAIGVAAAYGMALAARAGVDLKAARAGLAATRPTAVNLFWALARMAVAPPEHLLEEARRIEAEDLDMNQRIGRNGSELVPRGARILTVCNTGALATAGHGTALGVVRTAHAEGKGVFVYACETRPRMQGMRLTAYELAVENIPFACIADGAAASLMRAGKVDLVLVGADRIASNGDTANKIGTYALAVAARYHGVPFAIAAPSTTMDPALPNGDGIPIEERPAEELTEVEGARLAPAGCPVFNPAFDVTPGTLIDAIVTERGLFRRPYSFSA